MCPEALQFERDKVFTKEMRDNVEFYVRQCHFGATLIQRILKQKYSFHPVFSKDLYKEIQKYKPTAQFNQGDAARFYEELLTKQHQDPHWFVEVTWEVETNYYGQRFVDDNQITYSDEFFELPQQFSSMTKIFDFNMVFDHALHELYKEILLSAPKIRDSLKELFLILSRKNGYISTPPLPSRIFEKTKKLISDNPKAIVAGSLLGPLAFVGAVGAIGFGSGGIAAGSFAAWMMSLNGGATAAGSLVAILQSVGAAGLGVTGTLIPSTTGATLLGILSPLTTKKLDENPEKLAQLDNFVKIYDEGGENDEPTVVFEIHNKLLTNDNALDAFFKVFALVLPLTQTKRFKFLVDEACSIESLNILNNLFVTTYGEGC
ncbi:4259_t:CDS:2, partial [Cetraspora pellucida]